ncbi:hypothetical protein GUITHDRAFT_139739 [Guillardia theta CCMP2712]|uniref:Uncharacterized protein n=1 Tax=Guillardia theta (strain CCMP2712) TaxID=905079 RepID=L1J7I2_GUITC|nr:hypothetical protein GUITHDRAFT_139739 [Guillardia theta CCMP2712]EKX44503.1 hypothetical protein GUITHDRAFT_139739 [Guillardia theta CCMP2712]|eukprot:XP_005831483.1 hypothetical protein GUITHDRAFT_139739 [Guillardia theta CCMP2712]
MEDSASPAHLTLHSQDHSKDSHCNEITAGLTFDQNDSQDSNRRPNESDFLMAMESMEGNAPHAPSEQKSTLSADLRANHHVESATKDPNATATKLVNLSRASGMSVYSLTPLRSDDFSNLEESLQEQGSFPDSIDEYCPSHELDFSGISLGEKRGGEGEGGESNHVANEMDLSNISLSECKKLLVQSAELLSLERKEKEEATLALAELRDELMSRQKQLRLGQPGDASQMQTGGGEEETEQERASGAGIEGGAEEIEKDVSKMVMKELKEMIGFVEMELELCQELSMIALTDSPFSEQEAGSGSSPVERLWRILRLCVSVIPSTRECPMIMEIFRHQAMASPAFLPPPSLCSQSKDGNSETSFEGELAPLEKISLVQQRIMNLSRSLHKDGQSSQDIPRDGDDELLVEGESPGLLDMSNETESRERRKGNSREMQGRELGGREERGQYAGEDQIPAWREEEDMQSESRKSSRSESHVRFSPPTILTPKNLPDRSRIRSVSSISMEDVSLAASGKITLEDAISLISKGMKTKPKVKSCLSEGNSMHTRDLSSFKRPQPVEDKAVSSAGKKKEERDSRHLTSSDHSARSHQSKKKADHGKRIAESILPACKLLAEASLKDAEDASPSARRRRTTSPVTCQRGPLGHTHCRSWNKKISSYSTKPILELHQSIYNRKEEEEEEKTVRLPPVVETWWERIAEARDRRANMISRKK